MTYKSPSEFWRQYFKQEDKAATPQQRADKALKDLSRTVNIVKNSLNEQEAQLVVAWGGPGEHNKPEDNRVILDPDILLSEKSDNDIKVIDSLTGQVLTLSTMKRTLSRKAFNEAYQDEIRDIPIGKLAKILWEAKENTIAKETVLEDWTGFKGYFDAYHAFIFENKSGILNYIEKNGMNVAIASVIVAWNLQNTDDPIEVESKYQEILDRTVKELGRRDIKADLRYQHSKQIVTALEKYFGKLHQQDSAANCLAPTDNLGGKEEESPGQNTNPSMESMAMSISSLVKNSTTKRIKNAQFVHGTSEDFEDLQTTEADYKITADQAQEELLENILLVKRQVDPIQHGNYRDIVRKYKTLINSIVKTLSFRKTVKTNELYGLKEGSLDNGALYKIPAGIETIWARTEIARKPDIAICLLVDESGSMCDGYPLTRYEQARDVAIIMTEALQQIPGISIMVLGHTADITAEYDIGFSTRSRGHKRSAGMSYKVINPNRFSPKARSPLMMTEFFDSKNKDTKKEDMMAITGMSQNRDGSAMEFAAKHLAIRYPSTPHRFVFHISDGEPYAHNYHGSPAEKHMRKVVEECSKSKIAQIFGIGIADAYSQRKGISMYGENRSVVINDIVSSVDIITSFLRQIFTKI